MTETKNEQQLHSFKRKENNDVPVVYLNPYFEQIQPGIDLYDVLSQIADAYEAYSIEHNMDLSKITDFDSIKDKIACKLINREGNKEFSESVYNQRGLIVF